MAEEERTEDAAEAEKKSNTLPWLKVAVKVGPDQRGPAVDLSDVARTKGVDTYMAPKGRSDFLFDGDGQRDDTTTGRTVGEEQIKAFVGRWCRALFLVPSDAPRSDIRVRDAERYGKELLAAIDPEGVDPLLQIMGRLGLQAAIVGRVHGVARQNIIIDERGREVLRPHGFDHFQG